MLFICVGEERKGANVRERHKRANIVREDFNRRKAGKEHEVYEQSFWPEQDF